ncbi:MAG: 2-oxoglutarate dehydrogenase E1 component [Thermodesulfobacteriota bacterium]
MNLDETFSAEYMDAQYARWRQDPASVSPDWRHFFQGFELGRSGGEGEAVCTADQALKQARVEALKYRYRDMGHLLSCLDPLAACPTDHPLLSLAAFGLSLDDLGETFHTRRFGRDGRATLKEILQVLRETYCRSVGVEYMHLQDPAEKRWLQDRMEPVRNRPEYDRQARTRILTKLHHAALFEAMLNKKYPAQTRFSLEGAEGLIPMLDALVIHAAARGCRDVVLGMAHRGRLNVLVNILQKPYLKIFQEFANSYDPGSLVGAGDVKYHNGYLSTVSLPGGDRIRMLLVNNPSHLESVDPVVEGLARGLQDRLAGTEADPAASVLPVLIHGDAAFAGQGVVTETLNLSQLTGYATGGTLHIVINNQIGYTTLPENARSTRYSTDVAKMLMVPIFHVHGENPEALVHVVKLACDYRCAFGKDAVIDLVCYRRHGHNEGDEPYFTQPEMYARIHQRPPVHRLYADRLLEEGVVTREEIAAIEAGVVQCLEEQFQAEQQVPRVLPRPEFYPQWQGFHGDFSDDGAATAVDAENLLNLARRINALPPGFKPHPKLERVYRQRLESVEGGAGIDWANAEALAFASLVTEGFFVRLSGQDCARGTFSQRHATAFDNATGAAHTPLSALAGQPGGFTVLNSSLSETGVLGFEYGYSLARPEGLTAWEAQFGDFANNAQSVIDLYIVSGEAKWQRLSGLTLLLPHGWEGLGPEHSSARLERFLQLCAGDNLQVCNPTTPAQYFHLLRRQVKNSWRKPLVVMTPKSLLRNPLAVSDLADLTGGGFAPVLDDAASGKTARRVILTSGKLYYELRQRREENQARQIAILRLEQYHPFPEQRLADLVRQYARAAEWLWVQEEPENMGAWQFVRTRLGELLGRPLRYVGRKASPSPATGFHNIYRQEQAAIIDEAVGGK